ncbi:MAG TPA: SpoIIE family protein phosphatase [Pseudonocardiaceae bacterium]|nr:SpoIIE family protein phosphatase [Pseudonocardiaceae bacterium]
MARSTPAERVLLIEDDPGDAFLVGELLSEVAPEIELVVVESISQVLDGQQESLELLTRADCVLLDLNLPGTSGLEGLRQLLRAHPVAAICVLTGVDDEYLGIAAVSAGAQDYLVKGKADSAVLIRAVRYAVERRRAETSLLRLREQQLAAAESARLERGLLPRLLLDGSTVGAVPFYRAGRDGVIGGDFYDAIRCPDGSVHAIVGDVCGHGPDEAALGALLRVSWRALVLSGVGEPEVLPALQQVLAYERHRAALFTTACTVAIADGTVLVRVAGHPSPALLRPQLTVPQLVKGPPLGIDSAASWKGNELPLAAGWALLLYTDGLIEVRGARPDELLWEEGLLELLAVEHDTALAELPGRLVEHAERINGSPLEDDVAILLLSDSEPARPDR